MEHVAEKIRCTHCGEKCEEELVTFQSHQFCCYGCKAVYELLSESHLLTYYDNKDLIPVKVNVDLAINRSYAFLDHKEVQEKLFKYKDDKRAVVKFNLPGIHCSSCIYLLEQLPRLEAHVSQSTVNFIRKEVTITFDHATLSLKALAIQLAQLGYPPSIHLDSIGDKSKKEVKNPLGLKIAVAGFCFGNSMLMSLPEYLDTGFQIEKEFSSLFAWINLMLSLPIIFYSSTDYFKSAFSGIQKKYLNIDVPISLGIMTLFVRSFYEIVMLSEAGYVDSLAGLVFFLLIGKWYQNKSYQALSFDRDYSSYFPISVTKITHGEESNVLINNLEKGDYILIRNKELVPADCILTEGKANLDYSFVTGESDLVAKGNGQKLFAGGRQIGGPITVRLSDKVSNSELTQLWNNQVFDKDKGHAYHNLIDKVSHYFTTVVVLLAFSTGIYWYVVDSSVIWNAVSAVLIIACPCALALTLPFAYGHGMRLLGRQGLYLKSADIIERMSKIKEMVFDKTGTLTHVGGSSLTFEGVILTKKELAILRTVTANSAHPMSRIIYQWVGDTVKKMPITQFDEIPGKGIVAEVEGVNIRVGAASWISPKVLNEKRESMVLLEVNGKVVGQFQVEADYRKSIFSVLANLKEQFAMHLISGDVDKDASRLERFFDKMSFGQKPEKKLEYIKSLPNESLMIGDGLNDAGALKAADVGFGVAEDIYQFSPACDGVIAADSVVKLPTMMSFSKAVKHIVIMAFIISFAYNIIGLSFAISGQLSPIVSAILMPISSLTVVGLITLMTELAGRKYFNSNDLHEN